jgi:hypothetical protein
MAVDVPSMVGNWIPEITKTERKEEREELTSVLRSTAAVALVAGYESVS